MNALLKAPTRESYHHVYCELHSERVDSAIREECEDLKDSGCYRMDVIQDVTLCMWKLEDAEVQKAVLAAQEEQYAQALEEYNALKSARDGKTLSPIEHLRCVHF
jgi:hypothetical protein